MTCSVITVSKFLKTVNSVKMKSLLPRISNTSFRKKVKKFLWQPKHFYGNQNIAETRMLTVFRNFETVITLQVIDFHGYFKTVDFGWKKVKSYVSFRMQSNQLKIN